MSNKTNFDLSIIIVSHNTKELLRNTLKSVYQALTKSSLKTEIFVVDNASIDSSREMVKTEFQSVHLLENRENEGYAKANNRALKESTGRYVLLLNSDTIVSKDTLEFMISYMDKHPKVGVSTCRVNLEDGLLDPACHRGFPTPWASLSYFLGLEKFIPKSRLFSQYHLYYLPLDKMHEIDSPSGAFYLVRREVIDQVGLLDEDYFMYAEDLDWSYRIKNAGWKIMFVPDVSITHLKKRSGRENMDPVRRKRSTEAFYETMKIFYRKNFMGKYPKFVMWLTFLAINLVKMSSPFRRG